MNSERSQAPLAHRVSCHGILPSMRCTAPGIEEIVDYTKDRPAPQKILEGIARLYKQVEYRNAAGQIDPKDQRYLRGGGHFSRDSEWFKDMVQRPGAHLLVSLSRVGEETSIAAYSLFFTDQNHFPDFVSVGELPRLLQGDPRLGYTYLFLVGNEASPIVRRGAAGRLFARQQAICSQEGCHLLLHEVFISPIPNQASLQCHRVLERQGRAVFTELTSTHAPPGATTDVTYTVILVCIEGHVLSSNAGRK
jgi:hypothetical protein